MKINRSLKVALLTALMALFAMPPSPVLAETKFYKGQVSVVPNTVHVAGEEVFAIQAAAGGFTAPERAIIVERNINNALVNTTVRGPESVAIVPINGLPVIRIGGKHVVTVDSRSAQLAGTSMAALAATWADDMRRAMSDTSKIEAYVAELGGDFITTEPFPYRRARAEAAKLNHASTESLSLVNPDLKSSLSFEKLGMTNMMARDYCAAAENFKKALELDTGNAQAHYGLGASYLKLGQVDAAVNELQMARWLEPDNANTHIALGEAFETKGHDVDAVKQFKEAILLQPDNPEPYLLVADIRETRNDIGQSVAELTEGIKQMPNSQYLFLRRKDQLTWRLIRPF